MMWICEKCNLIYNYSVNNCISCGNFLKEKEAERLKVKGITKVEIPSADNKEVPYFNLLLEDEFGRYSIRKSFEEYEIGSDIKIKKECKVAKKKIGIIGTGLMGTGLTFFLLKMGYEVILKTRNKESVDSASQKIRSFLLKSLNKDETDGLMNKLHLSVDFLDLSEAEIIIESVTEDLNVKRNLFKQLDKVCSKNVILASNSSSISIDEIASEISNNKRVIGIHFFNPPDKMRLVEIINGENTSKETLELVIQFCTELNKIPVIVKSTPGFVVNRCLMPFINEAACLYESGISDATSIDTAIRLGLNHPMGPLTLADYIGLDTCVSIMEQLYDCFKESKYVPCPVFYELIKNGRLGKKAGHGFHNYA